MARVPLMGSLCVCFFFASATSSETFSSFMSQSLSSFTLINLPSLGSFPCISQMVAVRIPRPATCFFYKPLHLFWFSCPVLSFFLSLLYFHLCWLILFQFFSFCKRSHNLSLGDKEATQLHVLWVSWIAHPQWPNRDFAKSEIFGHWPGCTSVIYATICSEVCTLYHYSQLLYCDNCKWSLYFMLLVNTLW